MTDSPPDVCRREHCLTRLAGEYVSHGSRHRDCVTACIPLNALWHGGCSGGIKQVAWVAALQPRWLNFIMQMLLAEFGIIEVAARLYWHLIVNVPIAYQNMLGLEFCDRNRLVDHLF